MFSLRVNNEVRTFDADQACGSLLQYLREHLQLTGTKEGCATGDCGACSVVAAGIGGDRNPRPIDSCITPLGTLDGANVLTVEGLQDPANAELHPVQAALIEARGSQCGFCTPGIAMALTAHQMNPEPASAENRDGVVHAVGGNLCRCTGYRPIIDAGLAAQKAPVPDHLDWLQQERLSTSDSNERYQLPQSTQELLQQWQASASSPQLVAGATDLWLEVTQQYVDFPNLLDLSRVRDLTTIANEPQGALRIGAAVTHRQLLEYFTQPDSAAPSVAAMLQRFGSSQVRARGTLGGNIANGSPIADWPPVLLVVDATLQLLARDGNRRTVPLDHFHSGYRQTQLRADELIESVQIENPAQFAALQIFKNSKREDDDISTVLGAFRFDVEGTAVVAARIAYGGMAATPLRLDAIEALCLGPVEDAASRAESISAALNDALAPISDVRASAAYRRRMAIDMFQRAWQASTQPR